MSPPGVQVQRVLRAARPAGSGTSGPGAGPPGFSLCAADGVELDDVEELEDGEEVYLTPVHS
jgi:hypothetical protein